MSTADVLDSAGPARRTANDETRRHGQEPQTWLMVPTPLIAAILE